jgi:2-oxoglutarate/2-oxoacid ferredoxin oxidoreductase subunit beta
MSCAIGCSLLSFALEEDRFYQLGDYEGALPRWCAGCGDHSVLTAVQKLLVAEQVKPDQTVFVSGIGCSSRFPHYMKTYGFHGIHGRALPIATGVKLARPELDVWVVMGDGDCCSIGAAHWLHSTRYNMNLVALMLDNNIYGLTKNQTSPTTPQGFPSRTQPHGSFLPALNPLSATLGITNVSFVAQTAEWIPAHLYATLQAAHRHRGFSFVRILQRCPEFTPDLYSDAVKKPDLNEFLIHDDGVMVPELQKVYKNRTIHDPRDLDRARELAEDLTQVRLGVFFQDESRPLYEETRHVPTHTVEAKLKLLDEEFDHYAV